MSKEPGPVQGGGGFGFETHEGNEITDYGVASVRMVQVVMWEIDGFLDEQKILGPRAELDMPDE